MDEMKPPWKTPSFWGAVALVVIPAGAVYFAVMRWVFEPERAFGVITFLGKFSFTQLVVAVIAAAMLGHVLSKIAIDWMLRPVVAYDRWRQIRCIRCDYDVHTLTAGTPCPECGATPRGWPEAMLPDKPRAAGSARLIGISLLVSALFFVCLVVPFMKIDAEVIAITVLTGSLTWVLGAKRYWNWKNNKCVRCGNAFQAMPEDQTGCRCLNCGTLNPKAFHKMPKS